MRVAVISDTHFGDDLCTLVGQEGAFSLGPAYPSLSRAVGKVDYLVVLGDILDFSVASYEKAYQKAKIFFRKLQEDSLASQIIYVPGNHDFDIWNTVEHQVNVINQLRQGQLPRAFKRSVPGVIDDRGFSGERKLLLPDVAARPEWHPHSVSYGNLFLDHLTRTRTAEGSIQGEKLTFNFAYPNLYLLTRGGESILLTHGHYFEAYWSLASEWVTRFAGDDLKIARGGELSLREMVGINLPLSQLACTGIGQAQPLTEIARRIQMEVYAGRIDTAKKYLDRWIEEFGIAEGSPWPLRLVRRYFIRWLKDRALEALRTVEQTRYSKEFLRRPSVRDRFRNYYGYSLNEIARLRRQYHLEIPPPSHVIFGHTHQPIPWGSDELTDRVEGRSVHFCNTGGWLFRMKDGLADFPGAEVVVYETESGVRSIPVRGAEWGYHSAAGER